MPGQTRSARCRSCGGQRASMEGRAIARPNGSTATPSAHGHSFNGGPGNCPAKHPCRCDRPVEQLGFNGGPGNCPAKPGARSGRRRKTRRFNGGPGNCPAKRRLDGPAPPERGTGFNGGPGNCPAKHRRLRRSRRRLPIRFNGGPGNCPAKRGRDGVRSRVLRPRFNGGPGNCPAKRRVGSRCAEGDRNASMEGRAIARPNLTPPTIPQDRVVAASMEGRAIARPNLLRRQFLCRRWYASMEGRAIARPNSDASDDSTRHEPAFNGGPGNCPAKPWVPAPMLTPAEELQWRAGQLPRPNSGSYQNCGQAPNELQWRAGQLPGQTGCPRIEHIGQRRTASMEGRAIARPNDVALVDRHERAGASMEGRAIARPNPPAGGYP